MEEPPCMTGGATGSALSPAVSGLAISLQELLEVVIFDLTKIRGDF